MIDANGNPHVAYRVSFPILTVKYAVKKNGTWTVETIDTQSGNSIDLALDGQDNPRVAYIESQSDDVRYASAAVHLSSPDGGETWPVGGDRMIEWSGVGPVDILLSVDGGATYQLLESGVTSNSWPLRVPHTPTRFAKVRIARAQPFSTAVSDSFFTIEASIALLNLSVEVVPEGRGVLLRWSTDPGPEDLAGYHLEKQDGAGAWATLVALTRETSHRDVSGVPGDRYRLLAVNNFGDEILLGESDRSAPQRTVPLGAWPVPYSSGDLTVTFATASGAGGGSARVTVTVYDVRGRLVRTIVDGVYPPGVHTTHWDGRDASGALVPSGAYFLRSSSIGIEHTRKVMVVR